MKATIHTKNVMTSLNLSEPNDYKIFSQLDGPSLDELLEIVTPTITKRNTCQKQSLSVSIYPLCYAIWALEMVFFLRPEIHKCYISSIHWRYVYCSTDGN
jgi:hypothetical protein